MGALTGTPVVAVATGFMRHDIGGAGGNGAWLTGLDNFSYYYAHFSRYEGEDRIVHRGRRHRLRRHDRQRDRAAPALRDPSRASPGENLPVDPFATLLGLCNDNLPSVRGQVTSSPSARMAQLADAVGSKPAALRGMWVRIPLRAPRVRSTLRH